jgi:UDP-hydrolysing UDP-N-acetyl-D-glucosamine 2-epimerase
MSKKIAIFTGNRAEYGLQYPVLRAIDSHPDLEYQLMVSGAHLDRNFGNTIEEIIKDGFNISSEINIILDESKDYATSQAIGSGVIEISRELSRLKPDVFVVYADRFEGFAAVIASTQMNIPTAHIEGGDITEGGALDDSVRHAMTKLSHFHFTTNEQATNRILAMGEASWRVKTVGFPAIDLIQDGNYAKPNEIEKFFNFDLSEPIVLFTQHSVTTEYEKAISQLKPSLEALSMLDDKIQIIVTYPNNDAGGKSIIEYINGYFSSKGKSNIKIYSSLGRYMYHGVLALSLNERNRICCAGNSSSGIKETPIFLCPTVNIGSRQLNRLRGDNVIDAEYSKIEIKSAIEKCLFDEGFRNLTRNSINPYGLGDAGIKIANFLADLDLNREKILRKEMNLKGEENEGWFR